MRHIAGCKQDGAEIIGYGGITFADDSADIDNIAVSEAYRHSGVGTAILNALIQLAKTKNIKKVFLEVRVSNAENRKAANRGF